MQAVVSSSKLQVDYIFAVTVVLVKKRSEFGMVLMVVVEMMVVITIINYGGDVGTKDWDEGDGGGLYLS